MLTTISPNAQLTSDERGASRLDLLLYGSNDPTKNHAFNRARTVSPDEAYSAGYRDGFNRYGMLGSMSGNTHYSEGFGAGHNAMRLANL
ncbi:MAG: hypothetical protein KME43_21340 [Myxacorys chilensis ATA2-1-KO14]|jgi:hypothetical protein|nr:hypothetical protein [Myxacorys chilensis ATA2-1-KO14]